MCDVLPAVISHVQNMELQRLYIFWDKIVCLFTIHTSIYEHWVKV